MHQVRGAAVCSKGLSRTVYNVGAALHSALRTLDDVGRRQTFVQGLGSL